MSKKYTFNKISVLYDLYYWKNNFYNGLIEGKFLEPNYCSFDIYMWNKKDFKEFHALNRHTGKWKLFG